jgi:V/A-type H+-transporting ATPase subunit I
MKKVSVVVLDAERRKAVKTLRGLGLLHLETLTGSGEALSKLRGDYGAAESAYSILGEFKLPRGADTAFHLTDGQLVTKIEQIIARSERKKACYEAITQTSAELERFSKWGAVNPADFAYLAEKGVYLSLYEIPADAYAELPESVSTIRVGGDKSQTRFILVGKENRLRPADMPPAAFPVPDPRAATALLSKEIADLKAEIAAIDEQLRAEASYRGEIASYRGRLAKDIEFETVCTGMWNNAAEGQALPAEKAAAAQAAVQPAAPEAARPQAALAWLSGFAPAEDVDAIKKAAAAEKWALAIQDPSGDDLVPTKLKNNRLVSLIYPLTDFLETVPGYHEYDISGWFLLFFCVFFGMIFGDAGYGALLTVIAAGGIIASATQGKKAPPVLKMLLLLSLSTVAWGAITCTWFGLSPDALPAFFRAVSLRPLSNATAAESPAMSRWVKENLQIFCFSLALIQLAVAHIKGVVRSLKAKTLKVLGDLGQLLMLMGMFNVVLVFVVSKERFQLAPVCVALVGVGFVLSFVFSSYDGNIGASILESCKNIISVLLGVINVFSDIVSYIRLWAVGLAGSAISSTVNQMAGPTLGGFLIFLGILLLVFGHGLNMILNVLSVLVHGVRLNTLEFSSHLGMAWSGFAYRPFSEKGAAKN